MCPRYDVKQSDCEAPVMLELKEMGSTPSLPSLPGPLWPKVRAPDIVQSTGKIELKCLLMINWTVWNRTVFTFNWVLTKNSVLMLNWIVCKRSVWSFNCELKMTDFSFIC